MCVCAHTDRGMCCEGVCRCGMSPLNNTYRGNSSSNFCQCEPVEEACVDPAVSTSYTHMPRSLSAVYITLRFVVFSYCAVVLIGTLLRVGVLFFFK